MFKRLRPGSLEPVGEFVGKRAGFIGKRVDVGSRFILVTDIIDRGLGAGRQHHDPCPPSLDQPPNSAIGRHERGTALAFGFGLEQIGQPFGFGQVDPAVGKGTAGEFARLGRPHIRSGKQCVEDRPHHRTSSMALIFNDIFAGGRGRPIEPDQQDLVECGAIPGIAQGPQGGAPRRRKLPRQLLGRSKSGRPAGANDRHRRGWLATRQRGDRVVAALSSHQRLLR